MDDSDFNRLLREYGVVEWTSNYDFFIPTVRLTFQDGRVLSVQYRPFFGSREEQQQREHVIQQI